MSRKAAVERCWARPSTFEVMMASPPMRSTAPRASLRSALRLISSRSVAMSWNLTVELPQLRTRTFIANLADQVAEQAVAQLRLEPGRFGRHDFVGVGDGHQLVERHRVERKGRRGAALVNGLLKRFGAANA